MTRIWLVAACAVLSLTACGGGSGTNGTTPDGSVSGQDGSTTGLDGQVIGPDGRVIGPDGQVIGPDGQIIGPDGQIIGPDGQVVGPDGQVIGPDGQVIGSDGQVIGPDGQVIGPDGAVIGSDGGVVVLCGDVPCQCSNGIDDDGNGLVDLDDPECISPLDDDESSFATGIPGDNQGNKFQDCFFDGNSGSGNDGCKIETQCLLDADFQMSNPNACSLSQLCIDTCQPAAPNGCDCFGCCEVQTDSGTVYIKLAEGCEFEDIVGPGNTGGCLQCVQVESCSNDCATCELCLGKTELPAECYPPPPPPPADAGTGTSDAGTGTSDAGMDAGTAPVDAGTPIPECSGGAQPCGAGLPACSSTEFCNTREGCCRPLFT